MMRLTQASRLSHQVSTFLSILWPSTSSHSWNECSSVTLFAPWWNHQYRFSVRLVTYEGIQGMASLSDVIHDKCSESHTGLTVFPWACLQHCYASRAWHWHHRCSILPAFHNCVSKHSKTNCNVRSRFIIIPDQSPFMFTTHLSVLSSINRLRPARDWPFKSWIFEWLGQYHASQQLWTLS